MKVPKMTRAHFQLIADVLRVVTRDTDEVAERSPGFIAREFADALAATNPNFDRERFLAACGVDV